MTTTACVTAAGRTLGVAVGAGLAAKILAVFFDGLASVNDTEARVTGTFHLGNGGHSRDPLNWVD